jgi:hypothetical protein
MGSESFFVRCPALSGLFAVRNCSMEISGVPSGPPPQPNNATSAALYEKIRITHGRNGRDAVPGSRSLESPVDQTRIEAAESPRYDHRYCFHSRSSGRILSEHSRRVTGRPRHMYQHEEGANAWGYSVDAGCRRLVGAATVAAPLRGQRVPSPASTDCFSATLVP